MQVALFNRDKIIQELTDAFKKSVEIRDQLSERNGNLTKEIETLKMANRQKQWLTDRNALDDPERQISETTIDLVEESDFDDDELNETKVNQEIDPKLDPSQHKSNKCADFDEFKQNLNKNELKLFTNVQDKFQQLLNDEVNAVKQQLEQERFEKAELDSETNRLRQLLAKVKCGSTEITELRNELEKNHKKEMEDLRMYFERKCTDLEKQ